MKNRILAIIVFILLLVNCVLTAYGCYTNKKKLSSTTPNNTLIVVCSLDFPAEYIGEFKFTHYAKTGYNTTTGHKPRKGRTIAVDPKIIPLHSIVYIDSLGYFVAEDTGGAVKGKKIDIYVEDRALAIRLGTLRGKKLKVWIMAEKERRNDR